MQKGIFIAASIALSAIVWYIATDHPSAADAAEEKKTVKTIHVSSAPFQETATFSGFIRGERQSDIAAKTGGYILRLTKEEGDRVQRGETLAVIDGSELSAARQSALLSLQSMDKTLHATEKYYDQKVDEAKSAYDNASGSDGRDSAGEALKSAKRLRDAELASLKSQKAALEGSVLVSETSAANLIVRAPFDGIVTAKHASLGSFIQPGMPLYVIASPESIEITVSLPASVASHITRGSTVSVSDTRGSRVEGTVAALAASADETSQRATARIRFSSASRRIPEDFRIGEHVRVSFMIGAAKQAILIPEGSIISAYDDTFVMTVTDGIARRTRVTLGAATDDGRREILSGLAQGTHLVTEGMHALNDQQPVEETYAD
jgi:RND family efflux transporter MFP subunit